VRCLSRPGRLVAIAALLAAGLLQGAAQAAPDQLNLIEPSDGTLSVSLGEEACVEVEVLDEMGNPVVGENVEFTLVGTASGFNSATIVSDGNGRAEVCYFPLFPGTDFIQVNVGELEPVTAEITVNDVPNNPRALATGQGIVPGGFLAVLVDLNEIGGAPPGETFATAFFSQDVQVSRNGKVKGKMTYTGPFASIRSTKIHRLITQDTAEGSLAIYLGVAEVRGQLARLLADNGLPIRKGKVTVQFRVDTLDQGEPLGGDYFRLTLLSTDIVKKPIKTGLGPKGEFFADIALVFLGGDLLFTHNLREMDVKVRVGDNVQQ
jgi:hypothetical protein